MLPRKPRWRLNITQLLLLAALVGLLVGVGSAAWRVDRFQHGDGVCVSPDGKLVATWSMDGRIHVWDVSRFPARWIQEDTRAEYWSHAYWSQPIAFTDTQTLAVYRDGDATTGQSDWVDLTDIPSRQQIGRIDLAGRHDMRNFAQGGRRLVVMSSNSPSIDVWDLSSRQRVSQISLAAMGELAGMSSDGSQVIVHDWPWQGATGVQVWDASSGRLLRSIDTDGQSGDVHLSAQGKWLALVLPKSTTGIAPTFQTLEWEVVVYDVASGQVALRIACDAMYPGNLVFAPDDTALLCVFEGQPSRLVELPGGTTRTMLDDGLQSNKSYAFMPDGRRLVSVSQQGLAIWDAATGQRVQGIWQTRTTLQMFLFGGGFVLWAVVWGLLSRKWSPRAERVVTGDDLQLPPPPTQPGTRPPSFLRTMLTLLAMMCVLSFLVSWSWSDSWWMRAALGIGLAVGLVALILVVSVGFVMMRELLSKGYQAQLGRAVQVSGRQGRVRRVGRYTAWFVGDAPLEAVLPDEVARCDRRLAELLGPFEYRRPALILGFDDHMQMQHYTGRRLRLAGVYYGWSQKQLVMCPPYATQYLADPRRVLRTLLGFHALLERKGFWLPTWVQAVLNAHLMNEDDDDENDEQELRATHRRLRLALDREGLPVSEWLGWSRRQLARAVLQADEAAATRTTTMVFDIARSLSAYLLDADADRRQRFARFVQALTKRGSAAETFQQQFAFPLERLIGDWTAWLREQPTECLQSPPAWIQRQLVGELLPLLENCQGDVELRARAVRSLGVAGYVSTAGVLVELLERPEVAPRADVIWALECISGLPLGDDAQAWRAWWQGSGSIDIRSAVAASGNGDLTSAAELGVPPPQEPVLDAPILAVLSEPSAGEALPVSDLSDSIPPSGLRQVWVLMGMGGMTAITLSLLFLFQSGFWWLPTTYYGILVGTIAMARAIGRETRGLRVMAIMQIANLVSCDAINATLGVIELILLRGRVVKQYLNGLRM